MAGKVVLSQSKSSSIMFTTVTAADVEVKLILGSLCVGGRSMSTGIAVDVSWRLDVPLKR